MILTQIYLLPHASFITSFQQSGITGKIIVGLLVLASIVAWSIVLGKWNETSKALQQSREFLQAYRQQNHPLGLFLKRQQFELSPSYEIYRSGCRKLGAVLEARGLDSEDLFMGGLGDHVPHLSKLQVNEVRNVAERTMADQALLLENNMGHLATTVSSAPFLGLLGTVLGVMDAFASMASSGAALLSDVAPGISAALLTTVAGLVVAIPASIFYNMINNRIRHLIVQMDNFVQEYSADVERHFLQDDVG